MTFEFADYLFDDENLDDEDLARVKILIRNFEENWRYRVRAKNIDVDSYHAHTKWLYENKVGQFYREGYVYGFSHERDAILFKLHFG